MRNEKENAYKYVNFRIGAETSCKSKSLSEAPKDVKLKYLWNNDLWWCCKRAKTVDPVNENLKSRSLMENLNQ